jgi:hypothetical protein
VSSGRTHPYRGLPSTAYWRGSVSRDEIPWALGKRGTLALNDRVMSAGSCFASNLVPWLDKAGIEYVRTESPHPALAHLPENLGYRDFSAAYGNIYTIRQFVQLVKRAWGRFAPAEDRWHEGGRVIDPFRPGLRYPALCDDEFEALTAEHLGCVRSALASCTVLVFTLGLTEAWQSKIDGAVFPIAPGVAAGEFRDQRHEFVNFDYGSVLRDLVELRGLLDDLSNEPRLILTVSPVPLVATATPDHVLEASTYSKSVLRAAAGAAAQTLRGVEYFPAYEIVTGPQAPGEFFDGDARTVTPQAVEAVMRVMMGGHLSALDSSGTTPAPTGESPSSVQLSSLISEAECDEALLDDR